LKHLITGATGYIGGQMARRLHSKRENVICLTRNGKRVDDLPVIDGDLLLPSTLVNACGHADIVIHFAGALGRGLTPKMISDVNVNGTLNLIHAAKSAGVKYFLHISSGAVVGPREGAPADEKTSCYPYTPYEISKYKGECKALELAQELNLPLGVARPTFTYGPGDPHKLLMFKLIKKGFFFYIGKGYSTNHPVYIDDLLDGIELMLDKKPKQEVYILGGPKPVTKRNWAETIAQELNVQPFFFRFPEKPTWLGAIVMEGLGKLILLELPLTRSRILAMSKNWGMDISKAKTELGYSPKIDLKEGVRKTVSWYRQNKWL